MLRYSGLAFFLIVQLVHAETVTLPVTANAGISSIRPATNKGHDMDLSWGSGETLAVRQNQNWSGFENKTVLLKFDTKPIQGWTIKEVFLHIALAKDDLYGVGLCSIASDWREPTVDGQVEPGAPCWNYRASPAAGEKPSEANWWAWPDSGLYSVTWLHPALRYSHAGPNQLTRYTDKDGVRWLKIPVEPLLVSAMATGVSYGMVLTDDKGQVAEAAMLEKNPKPYTYDPSFEIQIYSRHAKGGALAPKLEVNGQASDKIPPGAIKDLKLAGVEPATGIASLEFTAPGDDGDQRTALAYEVSAMFGEGKFFNPVPRYSLPLPVPAGQKQTIRLMTLSPGGYAVKIHAIDKAGNAGADSEILMRTESVQRDFVTPPNAVGAAKAAVPNADKKMAAWCVNELARIDPIAGDAGDDGVNLAAAKNEVVAFQLIIERLADELKDVKVQVSDLKGAQGATISASKNIQLFREWYLNVDEKSNRWLPDACIPLSATEPFADSFNIPSDPVGATQKNQAVWVDVYVPKETQAGDYTGTIQISSSSLDKQATMKLTLHVRSFALPDEISFPVELNTYSGIGSFAGVDINREPERHRQIEQRFYQLAHQHRLTLNILRYTHSGRITENAAPPLEGEGADRHIKDWSAWDARFGPLLDGTAFSEVAGYYGPGMNTPVAQIYLPVHENWPMDLDTYYQDKADTPTRPQYAEYAKKSRRLDEAIEKPYLDGYTNVVSGMFKHFAEKGWKKTAFQFFLNNKYYYKCSFFVDPMVGGGNKPNGRCYWLLDEPVDFDDMDANRYFLGLAKRGVEASGVKDVPVQYRTDISNPHMVRGLWDGVCNLWDCSFLSEVASTALVRQKMLLEEKWWNYGLGIGIADPAGLQIQHFYHRYTWGCVGVLPYWSNFGEGNTWKKYSDLSVYYSGNHFAGSDKVYDGPIAGLRMKAMRRAQQDIEYLNLLASCKGWDRDQVVNALSKHADNPEGHSGFTFSKLSEEDLNRLRESVAATIDASR